MVAAAVAVAAATRGLPPPVVLISIDGLRPDYVLDADRHGLKIPNLRRLLAEGSHASGVAGVLPTVTYPSHTTLVTGVSPAKHGVFSNRPFDPIGRNRDGWYWYAEDVKVPTLWDAAAKAGVTTSSVDWPVTVGANITYNIVQYWRGEQPEAPDDAKLGRALSTPPGLLDEAEKALGPYPSGHGYTVQEDRRRAAFNEYVLEKKKPRLHLCYFSGLDEAEHASGPFSPATWEALEAIDGLVGDVRAAAEKAGGGRAIVAVVSDHGFSRATRDVELSEALREAGLFRLGEKGKPAEWRASVWSSGGSAAIVLRDPRDTKTRGTVARILKGLAEAPDSPIDRILTGDDARAAGGFPDAAFVVGLKLDAQMADDMDGGRIVRPAFPSGAHGYLPANGAMNASFFIAGPGIPVGRDLGRIDMRDVAPTVAALLRVPLPTADGRDVLE